MIELEAGPVSVVTTDNEPLSIDHWTDRAMSNIMAVSSSGPPEIREQAEAFRERIRGVVKHYMLEARKSDRAHIKNVIERATGQNYSAITEI